jgi:hypothetical protein
MPGGVAAADMPTQSRRLYRVPLTDIIVGCRACRFDRPVRGNESDFV